MAYIKREQVCEMCNNDVNWCGKEKCPVYKAPTADVAEVKHGYWIDKPSGRYLHVASWCSVCGNKSGIDGIKNNRHKPYCPNCGAKMDGKEDA